jgi:hypothetical protein
MQFQCHLKELWGLKMETKAEKWAKAIESGSAESLLEQPALEQAVFLDERERLLVCIDCLTQSLKDAPDDAKFLLLKMNEQDLAHWKVEHQQCRCNYGSTEFAYCQETEQREKQRSSDACESDQADKTAWHNVRFGR